MRHQKRIAKLGRKASHRKALLSNLTIDLFKHGKIQTTHAKAKALRSVAERLITYAKKGSLHHRRLALRILKKRDQVKHLFDNVAPQYMDRQGGYTRIIKLGFRDNDTAAVSQIELVDYKKPGEKKTAGKTTKKTKSKATKEKETVAKKETDQTIEEVEEAQTA